MKLTRKWTHKHEDGGHLIRRPMPEQGGLAELRREIDQAFERMWQEFGTPATFMPRIAAAWPALDMSEDDKAVTLRLDVPGLGPKDLDIEVSGSTLTIRGQRQSESSRHEHGVHRQERYYGSFSRTVTLPDYVAPDKIDARYDQGILTLTVPKVPGKGPRRVEVKT